jgi:hypothetical protein
MKLRGEGFGGGVRARRSSAAYLSGAVASSTAFVMVVEGFAWSGDAWARRSCWVVVRARAPRLISVLGLLAGDMMGEGELSRVRRRP